MHPDAQHGSGKRKVLHILINNIPDWVKRLNGIDDEIEKRQEEMEADHEQQPCQDKQARTADCLEVPPTGGVTGSGSNSSVTPSALRRQTRRVTGAHYYDGLTVEFFVELVGFISQIGSKLRKLAMHERVNTAVASMRSNETDNRINPPDSKEAKASESLYKKLEGTLNLAHGRSEQACTEIVRSGTSEQIPALITALERALDYANNELERMQAEAPADTGPVEGGRGTKGPSVDTKLEAGSDRSI